MPGGTGAASGASPGMKSVTPPLFPPRRNPGGPGQGGNADENHAILG